MDAVRTKAIEEARRSSYAIGKLFEEVGKEFVAKVESGELRPLRATEDVWHTVARHHLPIPVWHHREDTIKFPLVKGRSFVSCRLTMKGVLIAAPSGLVPVWSYTSLSQFGVDELAQVIRELDTAMADPRKLQALQREPFSRR